METRRLVKCNHSRKTAAFVRACVAYTFITIPSVSNVLSRLNLFVLSGRVAVANGALSQGEWREKAGTYPAYTVRGGGGDFTGFINFINLHSMDIMLLKLVMAWKILNF